MLTTADRPSLRFPALRFCSFLFYAGWWRLASHQHHAGRHALAAAIWLLLMLTVLPLRAADYATVIAYHRFGEEELPSTNITLQQFDDHLQELEDGGYTILPLIDIVRAIQEGEPLPDRSLAITIDDAFLSVYREAFPRLRERGFPFTLFVATEAIDSNRRGYMNWDQLRELQAAGVDIGSQSHSHPHMHRITLEQVRDELAVANSRFLEELGIRPELFAYPYGEYTPAVRDMVRDSGFIAAFGQHSGIMDSSGNAYEYPRFAFNENYGTVDRLKLAANALPIPATDITPESMVLEENPPISGFTIADGIEPLSRLACFASGMGKVETMIIGRRVEIRLPAPFTSHRGRINCTMPVVRDGRDNGRWRWFGRQFLP